MWYVVIILIVLMFLDVYVKKNSKRNHRTLAEKKGEMGERIVRNELNKLNKKEYLVVNDLYLPKINNETSQIDHVVISKYGIFVVETKNYKGLILGIEESKNWKQKIKDKSYPFLNPLWQNKGHIKYLSQYLKMEEEYFYSLVVFCSNANLKYLKANRILDFTHRQCTINISLLLKQIQNINKPIFSEQQIQKIHNRLEEIKRKNNTKEVKEKHVENIQKKLNTTNEQNSSIPAPIQSNIPYLDYYKKVDTQKVKELASEYLRLFRMSKQTKELSYKDVLSNEDLKQIVELMFTNGALVENTYIEEINKDLNYLRKIVGIREFYKEKEGLKDYDIFTNKFILDCLMNKPRKLEDLISIDSFSVDSCNKYGADIIKSLN